LTNQMNGDLNLALTNFQKHSATDDLISARKIATRNELMLLKLDSYFRGKENTELKKIKENQDTEIKSKATWISLLAAALVLLALGAGYWVYQNRLKQMKKVQIAQEATIHQMELAERIRKQIARDLHDDMGSTLSSISILSQVAEKELVNANVVTKGLLGKITQNSQRMLDTMNDIVWTTQPVNDSLESITIKIREFAAEMLDAKDIKYQIDVCEEILSQKLPPNHLYNFYLIVKEAINNIAKYAEAKNVKVAIKRINEKLLLTITDDGVGFEKNTVKGTGNGLKNMQKRSLDLGGALQIKSWVGQGTEINFELPID
jgi:signal transduction histidine kinase